MIAPRSGKEPDTLDSRDHRSAGSRRAFLKISGLVVVGGLLGLTRPFRGESWATSTAAPLPAAPKVSLSRHLVLHNTHTGETGQCIFAGRGGYLADGLARADRLLRDHRTGDVHAIDPALLDLLHDLAAELEVEPDYEIISGYRSPATNAMLRKRSGGVARRSYHMQGKAVDIRLRGVELSRLHRAAKAQKRGGVGLYSGPGFIHVDTGPVRTW